MERLVKYGVNQKKKRTLIDDQKYEYNFEKIKNETEFWRCQKFKKGCKGRAISRPSTNLLQNEPKHDHANNLVCKMARATEMAAIIKASENPSVTPRRILGEVSNTILASETPVVVHGMRSSDSFAQAVRRERHRVNPRPPVPKTWENTLDIPDSMTKTKVMFFIKNLLQ